MGRLTWGVLLVVFLAVCFHQVEGGGDERRACGSSLAQMLYILCGKNGYNGLDSESRRHKRGLVDDCCYKPCNVEDLRMYCAYDSPEVTVPEEVEATNALREKRTDTVGAEDAQEFREHIYGVHPRSVRSVRSVAADGPRSRPSGDSHQLPEFNKGLQLDKATGSGRQTRPEESTSTEAFRWNTGRRLKTSRVPSINNNDFWTEIIKENCGKMNCGAIVSESDEDQLAADVLTSADVFRTMGTDDYLFSKPDKIESKSRFTGGVRKPREAPEGEDVIESTEFPIAAYRIFGAVKPYFVKSITASPERKPTPAFRFPFKK